jgi:hypothetical protein
MQNTDAASKFDISKAEQEAETTVKKRSMRLMHRIAGENCRGTLVESSPPR